MTPPPSRRELNRSSTEMANEPPPSLDEFEHLVELLNRHMGADIAVGNIDALAQALHQLHIDDARQLRRSKPKDRPWQDGVIAEQIPGGATVLDLGCGDGDLLWHLRDAKQVRGQGVELDQSECSACIARGVPVLQMDIDQGLGGFADQSFDYVVLEETLQTLHRPVPILREMVRVGRYGLVSFPNFGHWRVRLDLAVHGRMPVNYRMPFHWHDTPNIHHLTIEDFRECCSAAACHIVSGWVLRGGDVQAYEPRDNVAASEALFLIESTTDDDRARA